MPELIAVLTRIADALERSAPPVRDYQAEQRKFMRFRLEVEFRFPGLVQRLDEVSYGGPDLIEAFIELDDGPAVLNYIAQDISALKKLCVQEPDIVRAELKKLAQRLTIRSVPAEG